MPSVLEQIRSVLGNDKCADCGKDGEYIKTSFCWSEEIERETTQRCAWYVSLCIGRLKTQGPQSLETPPEFACKMVLNVVANHGLS